MGYRFVCGFWRAKTFVVTTFLLALCCLLSSCSSNLHFTYEPNELSADEVSAENRELRIAVMTFEDVRPTKHSGSTNYAYIPVVPTWGETVSENQGDSKQFTSADYYYPGLLAYAIAKDIEANGVAGVVHLNPAMTDQYDLVIRGKLSKLEFGSRKITYGLSALGSVLQAVFLPTGWVSVYGEAEAEVFSPLTNQTLFSGPVKGDWGNLAYSSHEEDFLDEVSREGKGRRKIHGVVDSYREMSKSLLEQIMPSIKDVAGKANDKKRKEVFYTRLDPELNSLAQIAKAPNTDAYQKQQVAQIMQRRVAALEKYRQMEFTRLGQEDQIKRTILEKRLEAVKARRDQIASYQAEADRVEQERSRLAAQQMSAVMQGVSQGLAMRNQSGYYTPEQNMQAMAQDFATGASQMQMPNIPDFPSDELIAQLDRNLPGLPALGADPFASYGAKTLPEVRKTFLGKYRAKFVLTTGAGDTEL